MLAMRTSCASKFSYGVTSERQPDSLLCRPQRVGASLASSIVTATYAIDRTPRLGLGNVCREILGTVPEWFGISEANEAYVAFVETHETWVARAVDGTAVGIISGRVHFAQTAEIEVMAVRPEWHRRGVGRSMVDVFERFHRDNGVRMLEVKTLGPSREDPDYERTRAFYTGVGFVPIEELWIWGPANPALILCKPLLS
jgi:GNAT superfamily N-acetyltransferase